MSPESSPTGAAGAGTLGLEELDPEVSALREKSTDDSLREAVETDCAGAAAARGLGPEDDVAKSRAGVGFLSAVKRSAPLWMGG
jgi:hypothetical protein